MGTHYGNGADAHFHSYIGHSVRVEEFLGGHFKRKGELLSAFEFLMKLALMASSLLSLLPGAYQPPSTRLYF